MISDKIQIIFYFNIYIMYKYFNTKAIELIKSKENLMQKKLISKKDLNLSAFLNIFML